MTEQVEKVAMEPCAVCGSPCRVETFGPSNNLEAETQIWICSNAELFKGDCRSASAYLSADDWNHCNHRAPPDDSVARIVEFIRAYYPDAELHWVREDIADCIERGDWK